MSVRTRLCVLAAALVWPVAAADQRDVQESLRRAEVLLKEHKDQEAERELTRTVDLSKRVHGANGRTTAEATARLADTARRLKHWDVAERNYREAIRVRERLDGKESPGLAPLLRGIGWVLHNRGRSDEADEAVARAQALYVKANEVAQAADCLHTRGLMAAVRYRYADAEARYREELDVRGRVDGPSAPSVARALQDVGGALSRQLRFEEAEQLLNQARKTIESAKNARPADLASVQVDLGSVAHARGRWEEAIARFRDAIAILERPGQPDSRDLVAAHYQLGDIFRSDGRWAEAEAEYKRAHAVATRVGDSSVGLVLHRMARLAGDRGRYDEAERYLTEYRDSAQTSRWANGFDAGSAVLDLANLESTRGRFEDAERFYRQGLKMVEDTEGPDCPIIPFQQVNLGRLLYSLGRFAEADAVWQQGLATYVRRYGSDNHQFGVFQELRGIALERLGRFREAEDALRAATRAMEAANHPHGALGEATLYLADLLSILGRYAEADPLYEKGRLLLERPHGPDTEPAAELYHNLALHYFDQGRTKEAEGLLRRAMEVARIGPGVNQRDLAATHATSLGALLMGQGRFGEAEALLRRGYDIWEQTFGPDHHRTANGLSGLGHLCAGRGRPADARPYFERALNIYERVYGAAHPKVASASTSLAAVLEKLGKSKEAEGLYRRAADILRAAYGTQHPLYGGALAQLGGCESRAGRYAEAETDLLDGIGVLRKAVGPDHPSIGTNLIVLAAAVRAQGRADAARDHLRQGHAILEKALGPDHAFTGNADFALAVDAWDAGRITDATRSFDAQRRSARRYLSRELPFLPEPEQRTFLDEGDRNGLAAALTFGLNSARDPEVARQSAEWVLNGKAVAFEARTLRVRLDRELTDPAARRELAEVQALRAQEAALSQREAGPAAEPVRKLRADLQARRRKLEQSLAERGGSAAGLADPWVTLPAVRRALPANGLLVEIAVVRPARLTGKTYEPEWGSPRYFCWVIPKVGGIHVIDLGDADPINKAVADARAAVTAGSARSKEVGEPKAEAEARAALQKLADLVLRPLAPYLKGVDQLILSPDADLWLAPWAALPLDDQKYLVEAVAPRLVASGRYLVPGPTGGPRDVGPPVVVADPDFDAAPAPVTPELLGWEVRGRQVDFDVLYEFGPEGKFTVRRPDREVIGQGTWKQDGDRVEMDTEQSQYTGCVLMDKVTGERRYKKGPADKPESWSADLSGTLFGPTPVTGLRRVAALPGAAAEGVAALPRLKKLTGANARILTGAGATEAAVKKIDRPRVLLFATHGFLLPARTPADDPLLRCGLLLAGCNRADELRPGQEDGVLTGLEVVGLDLRGTELVVLSACDTAVGEAAAGDGVAGLRQAFELAGAADVLASLWALPDTETARLMGRFYDRWAAGGGRAAALAVAQREAITERKKSRGAAHPFYWAAPILTGRD